MAVKFSTVNFGVSPEGDLLPTPKIDPSSGSETYQASIFLEDEGDLDTLKSWVCGITKIDALGGGGIVVVERGPGKKTLIYPTANGGEATRSAILTNITARVRLNNDAYIEADAEWQLVDS